MSRLRAGIAAALCLAAAGCATGTPRPSAEGPRPGGPKSGDAVVRPPRAQIGTASWYGDAHHGRKTATGEVYDMTQLTAAHRTLPIGARVRVTNLANGRSVVVRINDRGPFKRDRVIDVSQAAARELGALGAGLFTVRLEVLEDAVESPVGAGTR